MVLFINFINVFDPCNLTNIELIKFVMVFYFFSGPKETDNPRPIKANYRSHQQGNKKLKHRA